MKKEKGKRIFESKASIDPQAIYDELAKSEVIPTCDQRADKIHSHPVIDLTMEELFS